MYKKKKKKPNQCCYKWSKWIGDATTAAMIKTDAKILSSFPSHALHQKNRANKMRFLQMIKTKGFFNSFLSFPIFTLYFWRNMIHVNTWSIIDSLDAYNGPVKTG